MKSFVNTKIIAVMLICAAVLSMASCSLFDNKFSTTQVYSEIKDDANIGVIGGVLGILDYETHIC